MKHLLAELLVFTIVGVVLAGIGHFMSDEEDDNASDSEKQE